MSKVYRVASREFKQTVLRPVFLIGVLGIPVLIVAIMAVAVLIMVGHKEPPLIGEVRIIAPTTDVIDAARVEFDQARIRADERLAQTELAEKAMRGESGLVGKPDASAMGQRGEVRITVTAADAGADFDSLKASVHDGKTLAIAEFQNAVLDPPTIGGEAAPTTQSSDADARKSSTFRLFVAEGVDSDNVRLIERRLAKAAVRVRAERSGLSGEQVLAMVREPSAQISRAKADGTERDENRVASELRAQLIPMIFMMLIWAGALTSGQMLMMSTIEEKSNRVMEVLLSAVSPMQLMSGKILGYGCVGLLIVGIYSSVGVAALIALATFTDFLSWQDLAYLATFFVMAYAMISCLFAAVGSAVSDVREANTLVTPVMLILMIPFMLWMPITNDPNGMVATVCSFVPPAIPFAMIMRIVSEEGVVWWQIALSIVWGYACVIGMVWFASRVFRVGVLMTGKPPSPLELIKWARYS